MPTIIEVLLDAFEHESKQVRVVIEATGGTDMKYTPKKGMRTLRELANHLAQIPLLDPAMYAREIADVEQARAREKELFREDIDGILAVLDEGVQAVKRRFTGMTEKEFLAKTLKPFYEKTEKSWAYYLPEFILHMAMHKMQLWMYLKLAGVKVDMMTYYGVTPQE